MSEPSFGEIQRLVGELSELDDAARAARLDEIRREDPALAAEVASLLEHAEHPPSFFERPIGFPRAAQLQPPEPEDPGPLPTRIGGFRILRRIATGGMGTVYQAQQDSPSRTVALKTIRRSLLSEAARQRFRRECDLLARLQHPGIAQIFEADHLVTEEGSQPYFAMEFVEGLPLTRHAELHRLDPRRRLELFVQICDAVEHAHSKGVVHRDLKPDNILVQPDGTAKVLDFGVAKAIGEERSGSSVRTAAGQIIGTLAYMSPEQLDTAGREPEAQSDVFSLGAILFELLSGRLPFDLLNRPLHEAARILREDEPTPLVAVAPECRGDLDTIVQKALERDPARRYPTAAALAADLRAHLESQPISARPPSTFYQLRKFARRHRALVGGVLATLLVAIAGSVVALSYALQSRSNARQATRNSARAERNEERALQASNRANLAAAAALLETRSVAARRFLDRIPEPDRSWEYHCLASRLEPLAEIALPPRDQGINSPNDVIFLRDGTPLFARATEDGVSIQRLEDGARWGLFPTETAIESAKFSEDGSRLAAISAERDRAFFWSLEDGPAGASAPLVLEAPDVRRLALSGDGRRVVLVDGAGGVGVHELENGRRLFEDRDPDARVRNAALSERGTVLAISTMGGRGGGQKLVLQHGIGAASSPTQPAVQREIISLWGLGLSEAAGLVCVAGVSDLELYSIEDLSPLVHLLGASSRPDHSAFAPGARRVAGSTADEILLWQLPEGRLVRSLPSHGSGPLRFSPDGRSLAVCDGAGARLWSLEPGVMSLRAAGARMEAAAFSPCGSLIATLADTFHPASLDGHRSVLLWDASTGVRLEQWTVEGPLVGLAFSADGRALTAWTSLEVSTWDVIQGQRVDTVQHPGREPPPAELFWTRVGPRARAHIGQRRGREARLPDRPVRVRATTPGLSFTDLRGQVLRTLDTDDAVRRPLKIVDVDAAGERIAVAQRQDGDGRTTLHLYTADDGRTLAVSEEALGPTRALAFSPDGARLISGGLDQVLRLWSTEDLSLQFELRGHLAEINDLSFSPDGTRILSASDDGTARLWDSLPARERRRQLQERAAGREARRAWIEARRAEGASVGELEADLHADPTLDVADLREAVRVLQDRP